MGKLLLIVVLLLICWERGLVDLLCEAKAVGEVTSEGENNKDTTGKGGNDEIPIEGEATTSKGEELDKKKDAVDGEKRVEAKIAAKLGEGWASERILQQFDRHSIGVYFHGFSRKGSLNVFSVSKGLIPPEALREIWNTGCYLMERGMDVNEAKTILTVIDVAFLRDMLRPNSFLPWKLANTMKEVRKMMKSYEPLLKHLSRKFGERIEQIILLHYPSYGSMLHRHLAGIAGVEPSKLVLMSSNNELKNFIADASIPQDFGGKTSNKLGEAPQHRLAIAAIAEEKMIKLGPSALTSAEEENLNKVYNELFMMKDGTGDSAAEKPT